MANLNDILKAAQAAQQKQRQTGFTPPTQTPAQTPASAAQPQTQATGIQSILDRARQVQQQQRQTTGVQTTVPSTVTPTLTPTPVTTPTTTQPTSRLRSVLEALGIGIAQAQRTVTGSPASTQQYIAENNRISELLTKPKQEVPATPFKSDKPKTVDSKVKAERDALVAEYNKLPRTSNAMPIVSRRNELRNRIDELTEQLGEEKRAWNWQDAMAYQGNATATRSTANYLDAARNLATIVGQGPALNRYQAAQTAHSRGLISDEELEEARAAYEKSRTTMRDATSGIKGIADRLDNTSDEYGSMAQNVEGGTDLGRTALGAYGAGLDLAGDFALNRLLPGLGEYAMYARMYGGGVREQEERGGDEYRSAGKGLVSAISGWASNKLVGGAGDIYGKSAASSAIENALGRVATKYPVLGNRWVQRIAKGVLNTEGIEEALEDYLNYGADKYLGFDKNATIDKAEVKQDALIGWILGFIATGAEYTPDQKRQIVQDGIRYAENVDTQEQADAAVLQAEGSTVQAEAPAETAPVNPADLLAEQVTGTAQEATETPVEAVQPAGDIPAPPTATKSTTAQPQALNSSTVEEPTQKRRAVDVASDLINRTGTTQSREAVTAEVQEIADYIKSNNNGEGVDPEVLRQMAERAALEMLDNIPGTQTGDPTVYNALRDFLTGRNIEISDELRGDVTDYNDWRKSLFGKLNMRKEGVSIDTLYAELSTQFPGLFPSDITAHSDKINRIVDVLESTRPQAGRLVDEISDADYNGLLDEATQAILDAAPDVLSTETSMSEENLASLDETAPPELLDMSRLQGTAPAVEQTASGTEATPRRSQTESHTLQDVAKKNGGTQEKLYYIPTSERQTMTEAMNRVNADMVGEMNGLADKDMWTAADIDTGMTLYGMLKADAVRTGDNTAANAWAKVVQSRGTKSGQALQAFSKWTRSAAGQASYASDQIAEASNLSSEEKTRITNDIYNFAAEIDGVEEGDVSSLREIIKRQSDYRGTGTIFEKNFEKILDQITDYEYLREYAQRQLMSMASDATDTATLGDKLKTWQVSAQLSRLGTFFRNIGGNVLFGAQDTLTQDGLGVALDWLVSKWTGKRTVGLDKSWFSAEARKGAKEAMLRSILEVAGDVNMDGDASKYGTTANRTNKMSGGKFSQFMSRWEQILGYSLTTSDRASRGSIETAIRESLKNSGLTDAEIDAIAEGTADYRLFQNKDLAYKVSKGLHDVMNLVGVGGEVRGVTRSGGFGAGDLVNPYPGVPANLAVKALEYSPANIAKGGAELFNLFRDIKNGTYDATKQNRAVMDIARGMAGTPIIALLAAAFKTGIIKNSDDEDDLDVAAQNRAEGKSGVQINLDAWDRANKGESAEWKDGDDLLSIGWLEPMNAFMAIASMIAAEDDRSISTVAGDYFSGTLQGLLEMPVMGNIANVVDSFRYSTADKLGEKVADAGIGLLGDAVSGMIPAPISQAARTSDLYYRDTGGDNKTEQVINNLLSSIPGARQTLPTKLDNFGRPKEYSNSVAQRFLNNFVLPGSVNELNQSNESKALEQLREASGETSFYPERKAPSKVNLPGENGKGEPVKLTTEEKRTYQETYGGTYTDLLSDLLTGGAWGGMTTAAQTETAKAIEAYAKDEAKRAIAEAQGHEYKSDYDDERKLPADSLADYFGAKESLKLARDNKDYSTLDALIDTLDEYPKAVRDKLYEDISRLEDMEAAAKKGVGSEEFTRAYDQYLAINKKDITPSDKAEEMKTWIRTSDLPKAKQDVLDDLLKYVSTSVVEAKTYDALREALGDPKMAQHFSHLKREEEANNAAEILTFVANDKEYQDTAVREKVLGTLLTEGQYAAYERAKAENISMGNWAKFLSEVSKAHIERTGKGGNPSKADIQAACNAMGWTTKADFNQVYKVYKGN